MVMVMAAVVHHVRCPVRKCASALTGWLVNHTLNYPSVSAAAAAGASGTQRLLLLLLCPSDKVGTTTTTRLKKTSARQINGSVAVEVCVLFAAAVHADD